MDVKRFDTLDSEPELRERLGDLYREAFEEIDTLAVQRHLLTELELLDIWGDPRVQKWVAFEGGEPVGVSVITNDLDAWPLISPRYFARHHAERYSSRRIWYIGFVFGAPGQTAVFTELISAMAPQVVEGAGMAVMDFASYNVNVRHIDRATGLLMRRLHRGVTGGPIDAQHFYGWEFPS